MLWPELNGGTSAYKSLAKSSHKMLPEHRRAETYSLTHVAARRENKKYLTTVLA